MIRTRIGQLRLIVLAVPLATVLAANSGCSSKNLSHVGQTATQQENISLKEGGPHEGRWTSGDVIVNYTYSNHADSFQIEGTVELTRRLTNTFRMVQNLSVHANLIGEERIILASAAIVMAGNSPIGTWTFAQEFSTPSKARAMNFSYSGSASEGGGRPFRDRDQVTTTFWQRP
jgi:hypothetical protein